MPASPLRSRSDIHAFVREQRQRMAEALATSELRWRAVRHVAWSLLVASAFAQYYFMDTMSEAMSLKSVVFTVPHNSWTPSGQAGVRT